MGARLGRQRHLLAPVLSVMSGARSSTESEGGKAAGRANGERIGNGHPREEGRRGLGGSLGAHARSVVRSWG